MSISMYQMDEIQLEELIRKLRQNIARLNQNSKQAQWERGALRDAEQLLAEKRSKGNHHSKPEDIVL